MPSRQRLGWVSRLMVMASLTLICSTARGEIVITEWMYSGNDGEFVELTNIGAAAIDLTGWSYDDDSRTPGVFDLSGFGLVQPGESVIFTEADAATFRAAWGLGAAIQILGGVTNNLGRNDEINIYDASNTLVDRLTYGDQNFPGTIRTQNISGWTQTALGTNMVSGWQLSALGDVQGSFTSSGGDLGNPGVFVPLNGGDAIPEPSVPLLTGLILAGALGWRVQRRRVAKA